MDSKCLQKKQRCPSIAGKLGQFVSLSVVITTLIVLTAFCAITYRIQLEERRSNLQAVAATVGKLIERPISLGDYGLVEAYLTGQNLPAFVESFSVKNAEGVLLAGQDFSKNSAQAERCGFTETVSIPVGKTSAVLANATQLTMKAGFCDIRSNAIVLGVGAIALAVFLVLVISIISRLAVKRALRPLTKAVNAGASEKDLSNEMVEKAPEEIKPLLMRLNQLYKDYLKVEASAKVGELAEQIAHDIRSPLTALRSMAIQSATFPVEQKRTLLSAIDRITDIANGLLKTRRLTGDTGNAPDIAPSGECHLVNDIIETLISEKREQYRNRAEVKIDFIVGEGTSAVFADLKRGDLQATLSNLIDNAFEAIAGDGTVTIHLYEPSALRFAIDIQDNGIGISEEHFGRLGEKGFTLGKIGGSGLGLYSAKNFLDDAGGSLAIQSACGQGTQLTISLPSILPPPWYAGKIAIGSGTRIVVIDDDASIHAVWMERFGRLGISPDHVIHVRGRSELERELSDSKPDQEKLFLIDFDLGHGEPNGLSLAGMIPQIHARILVTSYYYKPGVRSKADSLGIKILPKQLVPNIQLEVLGGKLDCVLIDDDATVQTVWKSSAKTFGKRIRVFSDPPADGELTSVPTDTLFYIDQNLRNGVRGAEVSKRLFEKGYRNLVLASGSSAIQEIRIPWVKKITIEKDPPWEAAPAAIVDYSERRSPTDI